MQTKKRYREIHLDHMHAHTNTPLSPLGYLCNLTFQNQSKKSKINTKVEIEIKNVLTSSIKPLKWSKLVPLPSCNAHVFVAKDPESET
jgi:hypothetical protein